MKTPEDLVERILSYERGAICEMKPLSHPSFKAALIREAESFLAAARYTAFTDVRNMPFEVSPRRPMETELQFVERNLNMFRKSILALRDKEKGQG